MSLVEQRAFLECKLLLHCAIYAGVCRICARSTLYSRYVRWFGCCGCRRRRRCCCCVWCCFCFCNNHRLLASKQARMYYIFAMRHRFRCCISVCCLFVHSLPFIPLILSFCFFSSIDSAYFAKFWPIQTEPNDSDSAFVNGISIALAFIRNFFSLASTENSLSASSIFFFFFFSILSDNIQFSNCHRSISSC